MPYFISSRRSRAKNIIAVSPSTWVVSRIQKNEDATYEAVVSEEGGKERKIKLGEGLYRKLKNKKKLVLGRHHIILP